MKAVKGNRAYTITEVEKEARRAEGFDIYDDEGKLIEYAKGKTIPYEEHLAVVEKLTAELTAAREEVEKLTAELKKAKKAGKPAGAENQEE
ncbi:MAG: hypothetical protein ACI3W7_01930 [Oscillospiraceae bacterium]